MMGQRCQASPWEWSLEEGGACALGGWPHTMHACVNLLNDGLEETHQPRRKTMLQLQWLLCTLHVRIIRTRSEALHLGVGHRRRKQCSPSQAVECDCTRYHSSVWATRTQHRGSWHAGCLGVVASRCNDARGAWEKRVGSTSTVTQQRTRSGGTGQHTTRRSRMLGEFGTIKLR